MQLLLSVRSSEVLQKLLMIGVKTWRRRETNITVWAEVTRHIPHTSMETYFAPPFLSLATFICWKVLSAFLHCAKTMAHLRVSHVSFERKSHQLVALLSQCERTSGFALHGWVTLVPKQNC